MIEERLKMIKEQNVCFLNTVIVKCTIIKTKNDCRLYIMKICKMCIPVQRGIVLDMFYIHCFLISVYNHKLSVTKGITRELFWRS